jgi:hypothetical protein
MDEEFMMLGEKKPIAVKLSDALRSAFAKIIENSAVEFITMKS